MSADVIPKSTVPTGSTHQWRDRKRYLWLVALVVPSLVFGAWGLASLTGWTVAWYLGPVVVFGVVPVLDLLTGLDESNPPDDVIEALENDRYYRWVTFCFLPVQYAGLVLAGHLVSSGDLSVAAVTGLTLTVGVISGVGINTAHELGHKKESVERWLAKVALAPSWYGHFFIEHNRGHHVRVATPEDPASSRLGETVYAFLPRTIAGSVVSAWNLERRRITRRRRHPFTLGNDVLNSWLMSAVLWGTLVAAFGPRVLPLLVGQAVVGIVLLEIVNYLEHYGMRRRRTGPDGLGRYERVDPSHSWNSNHITTNVLLYHLQRHSDHHANPTRRYQCLRDYEQSPALPTGYAGMILLALVPPLWRRVMDPRVVAHFDGDVTAANVDPRHRVRLTARYGGEDAPISPVEDVAHPAGAAAPGGRVHACPGCGYRYDEARGDGREGFEPGTSWASIPSHWCCPDCGVRDKADFVTVAGGLGD